MATSRRTSRAAEPADDAPPARGAARGSSRASSRSAEPAGSSGYRGAAGIRKMQEESVAADARREASKAMSGAPFRFFLKAGETRELVIVDDMPDFVRWEHTIQDKRSKQWSVHTACIDDHANCPVCAVSDRPSYFALYLTVIDLSPFTTKDGEEVEFSKKLLVIKQMQQKKFMRLYDQHKTLRGMVIEVTRDSDKDAAIGNDIQFIDFMDEEELLEYQTEYVDKEKKVHHIDCSEPYDYDAIFPAMTETQLRALVGGKAGPGSRDDTDRALGRGRTARNADNWDDSAPPSRRAASRRGAPEQDDPAGSDDGDDGAGGHTPPPRRAARGAAAPAPAPAPRRAARGAPAADDGHDDDAGGDPPFEESKPRRTARGAAAEQDDAPQRPARGRAAPAEPAPRAGVAARRAALRR